MKVELWMIGKTAFPYLAEGIAVYEKRLKHYLPFEMVALPDVKNAQAFSVEQLKSKEGLAVLEKLNAEDSLILLDERGKSFSSEEFALHLERLLQSPARKLVFLIGGAQGFSEAIYHRANHSISLSKMTFSHQMVRLFVVEQLYRALTILRGEPYHNS